MASAIGQLAASFIAEMAEFASFPTATQRYIRRSLDVALGRGHPLKRWPRNSTEVDSIRKQARLYARLDAIRASIPDDSAPADAERLMAALVVLSAFDLGEGRLGDFAAYRFLYERLIGPAARPWLPSAFCAAAALPHLHPTQRTTLLRSVGDAAVGAAGWSTIAPVFSPEWVDKVEPAIASPN